MESSTDKGKHQKAQRDRKLKGCDRCRLCHGRETQGLQVNDLIVYLGCILLLHHPDHPRLPRDNWLQVVKTVLSTASNQVTVF